MHRIQSNLLAKALRASGVADNVVPYTTTNQINPYMDAKRKKEYHNFKKKNKCSQRNEKWLFWTKNLEKINHHKLVTIFCKKLLKKNEIKGAMKTNFHHTRSKTWMFQANQKKKRGGRFFFHLLNYWNEHQKLPKKKNIEKKQKKVKNKKKKRIERNLLISPYLLSSIMSDKPKGKERNFPYFLTRMRRFNGGNVIVQMPSKLCQISLSNQSNMARFSTGKYLH